MARCSLALNRELVFVPLGGKCPECGLPLRVGMSRRRFKFFPLIVLLAVLGVGGYYVKTKYIDTGKPITMNPSGGTPSPDGGPSGSDLPTATPVGGDEPKGGAVDRPTFGLENDANAKARRDVLSRIDLMPHLTPAQKAKLTSSVDRARGMGCIFIIPFEASKKALGQRESDILLKGFQSAGIQKLMEDPTLVFVILGYADKQTNAQQAEKASIDRAQSVLSAMRERCNVQNVMYAVGMGGSEIFDAKQGAKNRLVEIWAVYP
jgi:hypothetical protein